MEIVGSWKYTGLADKSTASPLGPRTSCVSPDGSILCIVSRSSADFHTPDHCESIPLHLGPDDSVTCVASVCPSPWLLCAGTAQGFLVFFSSDGWQLQLKVHTKGAQFLKACVFKDSQFTHTFDIVFAQFGSQVAATVSVSDVLLKRDNKIDDFRINKWRLSHKHSVDAVVVNSSLQSPIFSGMNQFPAVFSVGSNPFISVDSILKAQSAGTTERVKKAVSNFWRFAKSVVGAGDDTEQEEEIPNAKAEWDLYDEGRCAREVMASEQGRWLAVTDTQGRVSIVDCVFGHITRVMKGFRDAQVAWCHEMLIVFAPARGMIVACTVPNGEVIDAAKVDKNGRVYQMVDENGEFYAVFVDSHGSAGKIECKRPDRDTERNVESEGYHFRLPA